MRRLSAVALAVGLVVMTGCADVSKFDKDQQTADEEGRKIKVPSGIQAAFDSCLEDQGDGPTTTAKGEKTTTTLG